MAAALSAQVGRALGCSHSLGCIWFKAGATLCASQRSFSSITGEQSWHRRARRQRQAARGILAVARAERLLRSHHGGGMPPGTGRKACNDKKEATPKDDWLCKTCTGKDGLPFRNKGFRMQCLVCKVEKGACFGKKASPQASSDARLRAEDIVAKRALAEKRSLEHKHALEVKQLKDELAEVRKSGSTQAAPSSDAACHMDLEGEDEPATVALTAAVERAREKLTKLKQLPVELRSLVEGGFDACCNKVQQELADAQAARRAANPLKKQVAGAEAFKARMEKKLADEKAMLSQQEVLLADITDKINKQKVAVQEAEAAAAKAATELASLAAQLASEHAVSETPAKFDETPQAQPGFVSVEFAEAKWAEREAVFAQQLAQLQALVSSSIDTSSPAECVESTASEADASDAPDQLDDEAWNKVEPTKRKALLHRQRDILAKKVRANLGKVSTHASPFKKT